MLVPCCSTLTRLRTETRYLYHARLHCNQAGTLSLLRVCAGCRLELAGRIATTALFPFIHACRGGGDGKRDTHTESGSTTIYPNPPARRTRFVPPLPITATPSHPSQQRHYVFQPDPLHPSCTSLHPHPQSTPTAPMTSATHPPLHQSPPQDPFHPIRCRIHTVPPFALLYTPSILPHPHSSMQIHPPPLPSTPTTAPPPPPFPALPPPGRHPGSIHPHPSTPTFPPTQHTLPPHHRPPFQTTPLTTTSP